MTDLFGHEVKNSVSWLLFVVSYGKFIKLVFVCLFVLFIYRTKVCQDYAKLVLNKKKQLTLSPLTSV